MKTKSLLTILLALMIVFSAGSCGVKNTASDADIKDEGEEASETEETASTWEYDGSATIKPKEKTEIVRVDCDASGITKRITSHVTLSGIEGSGVIEDRTNLTGIKNELGEEAYSLKDGALYWENKGHDIEYKGKSNGTLPVEIVVTYFLDDKELSPSEIKGKSGHIKVRYDFKNMTYKDIDYNQEKYNLPVPFKTVTTLSLDEDSLHNIKTTNCDVIYGEGASTVVATLYPSLAKALGAQEKGWGSIVNLPDYFEFEGDTDDFTIGEGTTIVENAGLVKRPNSDYVDGLINVSSNMGSVVDGLSTKAVNLLETQNEYNTNVGKYIDDVVALDGGIDWMASSASILSTQKTTISDSATQLNTGLTQINPYLVQLEEMIPSTATQYEREQMIGIIQGVQAQITNLSQEAINLNTNVQSFNDGLSQLSTYSTQLQESSDNLLIKNDNLMEWMSAIGTQTSDLDQSLKSYKQDSVGTITNLVSQDVESTQRLIDALKLREESHTSFSGAPEGVATKAVYVLSTPGIR